ncbi:MAG: N(4)-(beta-N-acetylglucosaminyl)-L-asparaginase [Saprospiraceae bacterium]|nr:N(4)-(beta-N-acetylglucosaminyl)-L-asparaginase [Bacteroidia bacterium]NNF20391.1 N(4)-(beta-N-acetylglucosaminyl)-L-asparaginase [Saprospiraceae bacterium]
MLRRSFFSKLSAIAATSLISSTCKAGSVSEKFPLPFIISTWNNQAANKTAVDFLTENPGDILSSIEKGINYAESDPLNSTVGYGGMPDSEGNVTLDSCIMNHNGEAGAVTYLKNIKHPVSVARKVMENTPHVTLSGEGALKFALEQGFKTEELLTEKSRKAYKKWLEKAEYSPKVNIERHDTIGMLGIDAQSRISGACSTSGLAFKKPGRVGDSPVIGSGLFVDNQVGAATATGLGEVILENCSTFLVVEFMRQGFSPQDACEKAVKRIAERNDVENTQVALVAINKNGEYGAFSIQKGFQFTISSLKETKLIDSESYFS